MATLEQLSDSIRNGKRKDTKAFMEELVDAHPPSALLQALTVGMDDVGRRFKANEIFVPEVLIAARAMKTAMEILEPRLVDAGIRPEHKVVVGTVKGDMHDIGKNLVCMMLKGANFEVIDLGVDVDASVFVDTVRESGAGLVAMSALLTTTMGAMKDVLDRLRESGIPVKTMVGGAPITKEFADEIGADGFADDAASAVDVARMLVGA